MEEYVWISKIAHHPEFTNHAHPVLERLAAHHDVKVTIAGPDDASTEAYVGALRDAIERRVAGIMVIGWGDEEIVPVIDEAVESGIPVVTVDADVPMSKRLAHVGTDWFRMGSAMAKKLADLVGGRGKVLTIGMRGLPNVEAGFRGFKLRIAAYPEIEVLGPEDDLNVRFDRVEEIVTRYFTKHRDLAGVAGFDGNSGLGAALALEKAGLERGVKLVSVDADALQIEHIRTGAIDAAFCQKREAFTYLAFQMLYAYNNGSVSTAHRPGLINIPGNIDTGHIIVTADNRDSFESELNLDEVFAHHELAQQLTLLSAMVENIVEIALATDLEGRVVYANPAAARFFGYSGDELLKFSIGDLFDLSPEHLSGLEVCIRQGRSSNFETLARKNDGDMSPVQLSISPLRTDSTVRGLAVVAADITERKRAEQALAAQRNLLGTILAQAADAIVVCDAQGKLTFVNAAARRLALMDPQGTTLDITPAVWGAGYFTDGRLVPCEQWIFEMALRGEATTSEERRMVRADGSSYDILVSAEPLRTQEGEIIGAVTTFVDITARRRAEEALRREHDFATKLLEIAHTIIVVLDVEGRIVQFNRFAERLTGWSENEVRGKDWYNTFVPEGVRASLRSRDHKFLSGEVATGNENPIIARDGREILVRWYSSPLRDASGKSIGVLATGYDVTELKEKEEELRQAQKMEAIGRLAGGIAHDFNNQLTVVTGYSDLLLATLPEGDPAREQIEEIYRAATRASTLTNQLLAFSRKQVLHPQVINLNNILEKMASPVARMIGEDIRLSIVPDAALGNVMADPMQVEQAIMNLIVNARDAMPQGGELTIETANVELRETLLDQRFEASPGPYVMIAVTDTGIGMDVETQREIFEPFFTTKPTGEGTGLGLSMVYGFVKQSGGHIEVESELGRGTTLRVYLPHVEAPVKAMDIRGESRPPRHGTETILIVEDEEAVRHIAARVLRECGYTVLETGSAREALPIGEHYEGHIALLITDVIMPETSGPELARRLKRARPDMRVLYITGYAQGALVQHGIEGGRGALLTKPFTPSALTEAVRSLLDVAAESSGKTP